MACLGFEPRILTSSLTRRSTTKPHVRTCGSKWQSALPNPLVSSYSLIPKGGRGRDTGSLREREGSAAVVWYCATTMLEALDKVAHLTGRRQRSRPVRRRRALYEKCQTPDHFTLDIKAKNDLKAELTGKSQKFVRFHTTEQRGDDGWDETRMTGGSSCTSPPYGAPAGRRVPPRRGV